MNETPENIVEEPETGQAGSARPVKASLTKQLPTDRVSFDKQMSVLRAYAAASGHDKRAVNNDEVAKVMIDGLAASSISLCNPFLADAGLLTPAENRKQRPHDAVFDYLHAFEWSPETSAQKLGRVLSETWAAKSLMPKLSYRQMSKDEAIAFLAEDSKATKAHRKNLETLLDFLSASGVIRVDGNTVMKASVAAPAPPPAAGTNANGTKNPPAPENDDDVQCFTIPVPNKKAATITFPKNLDADDWTMVTAMMGAYMKRLKGFEA